MDISKLIHLKFKQRQKSKKPFPDAVIYHTNSDYLEIIISPEQYQLRLERLLLYLKRRVSYVMIISPGLYTSSGEVIDLWEDHSQRMVRDIIKLQVASCEKTDTDHVNFREIMQDKLRAAAKDGKMSRDLSDMIGKKREWKVEAENEKMMVTTYDYKSKGGIYTFDGEHTNAKGTGVLVDTIALRLKKLKAFWTESSIHKQVYESKHRKPHK